MFHIPMLCKINCVMRCFVSELPVLWWLPEKTGYIVAVVRLYMDSKSFLPYRVSCTEGKSLYGLPCKDFPERTI